VSRAKLYYLHQGLPRQGPGTDASTRDAIHRLGIIRSNPRILDIGCGPGRASVLLAQELQAQVTSIDIHQPYLDHLAEACKQLRLRRKIKPLLMSMEKMTFEPKSFDLIWAEGSAYFMGIRRSLETWMPLMHRGIAVFSELCWLTDDRPAEAVEYWAQAYPEMRTPEVHIATAKELGYDVVQHWILPEKDWWPEYLTPLEARMKILHPEARKDRTLRGLIADSRCAIDLFRRHSASFGYVFFMIAQLPALQTPVGRFAVQPPSRQ